MGGQQRQKLNLETEHSLRLVTIQRDWRPGTTKSQNMADCIRKSRMVICVVSR